MLETERLILRRWMDSDREPFFRMNAHPEVMRHMPGVLSRRESDQFAERIARHFAGHGYGLFAVELKNQAPFIGFIGLQHVGFQAAFAPAVEIGWRLDNHYWNRGLATEGARRVLDYAFRELTLEKVVSFTAAGNLPSRRVMEKIGLLRHPGLDFEHPNLPDGHPLRPHVLYSLERDAYLHAAEAKA